MASDKRFIKVIPSIRLTPNGIFSLASSASRIGRYRTPIAPAESNAKFNVGFARLAMQIRKLAATRQEMTCPWKNLARIETRSSRHESFERGDSLFNVVADTAFDNKLAVVIKEFQQK